MKISEMFKSFSKAPKDSNLRTDNVVNIPYVVSNNSYNQMFLSNNYNMKTSSTISSIVRVISSSVANMNLKHAILIEENEETKFEILNKSELNNILQVAVNEYFTPYNFWNYVVTQMIQTGQAIVMPKYVHGKIQQLKLLSNAKTSLNENENVMYVELSDGSLHSCADFLIFNDPNQVQYSYAAREVNMLDNALLKMNESFATGSNGTCMILKSKADLSKEEFKNAGDDIVRQVSNILTTKSSVAMVGAGVDVIQLNKPINQVTSEQLDTLKSIIYDVYGVNKNIMSSNYSEQEWIAFNRSVVEPYQNIIIEELNKKLITLNLRNKGHKIINVPDLFKFATTTELVDSASKLLYQGVMNKNEIRAGIGFTSYKLGNKYETNLNAEGMETRYADNNQAIIETDEKIID